MKINKQILVWVLVMLLNGCDSSVIPKRMTIDENKTVEGMTANIERDSSGNIDIHTNIDTLENEENISLLTDAHNVEQSNTETFIQADTQSQTSDNSNADNDQEEAIVLKKPPKAVSIEADTVIIEWSLNKVATGQVEYGISDIYGEFSQKEPRFKYDSHTQRLKNLIPSTTYHYRVISEDANGKKVVSEDKIFRTLAVDGTKNNADNDQEEAIVLKKPPKAVSIGTDTVIIEWSLNHKATGQVEYGTTSSYGMFSQKEPSFKYDSHAQRLKNLQPNTTYHYRVISQDEAGKSVISGDNTFKTTAVDNETFPIGSNAPIWIIGDSTVVNGDSQTPPRGGWGEFIPNLVKNGSRVRNKAVGGSTAKSFFDKYWDKVKQEIIDTDTSRGAYLFIEFGHNDRDNIKSANFEKATVPGLGNEYDEYLMEYIDFARANNVTPVLVTGTASMCKDSCGSRTYIRIDSLPNSIPSPWKDMIGEVGDWPKTKREVGAREDVTVLDLTTKSIEHFATFDNMQSLRDKYAWKPQTNDDTHFNKVGARKMAELIKDLACDLDNGGDAALCSQFKEDGTKRNTIFPEETAMTPIATKSIKKLAVGESVVGSAFGGTITRMTETGARTNGNEHPYAKIQAWNSDMSMIRLTSRLYDANTLKELDITKGDRHHAYAVHGKLDEIKWSSINPNIFYGVKNNEFWKGVVDRANKKINLKKLHSFSDYSEFKIGHYEGNIDFNDKYVVFSARKKGSDYLTAIIYDIEKNKIKIKKDLLDIKFSEKPKPKRFDWISVDPKGEFVVIRDGYKVYRYDMNLNNKTTLAETAGHGDLGIDQNGDSIYVQWGFGDNNGVWMYRLKDLHKTKLMPKNYGSGHISCRNKDRKGWCYLSTVFEQYREVFAIKLDYDGPDSPIVNRFAQTHESGIRSSVATVSPDGSRVIFMSDWGTKVDDYRERSTYHVEFK